MPTIYPSARTAIGVGKESTPGTAVAAARWAPDTAFLAQDMPSPLLDQGMRGSMASEYGLVMGPEHSEGSFDGPFFDDTVGDYLYNILGDYSVGAPVSSVYPHTFGLLNSGSGQPVTHTFVEYDQLTASTGARVWPYACLSELVLSGDGAGLCQVSGKFSAFPSAAAGLTPTNTPTTETVIPGWRSTVSYNAAAVPNIISWSVTMTRQLTVQDTADGTQSPYVIARGALTVAVNVSVVAIDETPLTTNLLTNPQSALVIVIDNGGATTAVRKLTMTMTKGAYTDTAKQRNDLIGWTSNIKALANSTDAASSGGLAPIKCVLQNAITTY